MFGWHHAVSAGPGHEDGAVEARQAFGATSKLMFAAAARSIHGVAPDLRLGQHRLHLSGGGRIPALGQPAERDRQPPHRPDPHLLHEQPEHPGMPGRRSVCAVSLGGKLSNASQEASTTPAHASGTVAHHQPNKRPAGVVADEG